LTAQFVIERSTNAFAAGGPITTVATVNKPALTYKDTTVVAGNVYSYRVSAKNGAGTSTPSTVATVSLLLPAAPGNLAANFPTGVVTSTATVTLSWVNTAANANSLLLERATDSLFTANMFQVPLANSATTYSDTTALVGVTYYYRVAAVNNILGRSNSGTVSGFVASLLPPTTPTGLAASVYVSQVTASTANTAARVELTWANGLAGQTGLTLLRGTNNAFTGATNSFTPSNTSTNYSDTSVTIGATYYYAIRASNAAGSSAYSTAITSAVPSANAPATFTATAGTGTGLFASVNLAWSISAAPTATWTVQRSTDPTFQTGVTASAPAITARTATQTAWNGVASRTTYYFRIRANYSNGTSSAWLKSNPVSVTTN
jgi:titin